MAYTGQSIKRFEDPRLVTGQGTYTDDVKIPGMLYASFLRSPHAHARIRSVDASEARNMPGVVAVLTADDLVGKLTDIPTTVIAEWEMDFLRGPEVPILARDKVCYVGQAVAVAVAEEKYQAKDASERINVEYEPLPVMLDPLESVKDDSIKVHEEFGSNVTMRKFHDRQGSDLDKAFTQADRVVRQQYTVQRLAAVPMETRGCVAHYQPDDDLLTVWASTQSAHNYRHELCSILGRSEDKVRVIAPDVGGGFGEKHGAFPEDMAIAHLSIQLGRPVNWIADRQENQLAFHGRGHSVDLEAAVKNDGTILGIRMRNVVDGGGFCGNSTQVPPYTSSHRILGPYKTPAARIEVLGTITNKGLTGAYRGAGGPEAAFCMERTMDLVARELGLDPADVRRKNFITPDEFPYETPTGIFYDSGEFEKSLDRALELADYRGWQEKARQSVDAEGPLIGVGLATCIKMGGAAGTFRIEDAWINMDSSGKVTARTGVSPHGQGSDVTFAQIVADEMGVTPYDVEVLHGDTDVVPSGLGTGATRGMVVGGSAMLMAARDGRQKLVQIASHMLKCSAGDVALEDGRAYNRGNPAQAVTISEVAAAAYNEELLPPDVSVGLDFHNKFVLGGDKPHHNPHAFGAHVVVVEVDRDTGDPRIVKYVAVSDCGRVINPMIVDGQVHGAIAQGIGQALTEGMDYTLDGQPLTATLMDYAIPVAEETPSFITDHIETPSPLTPTGAKGIGEMPTVVAPGAVANAVLNALSHVGVRHIETPLTPEKIWRALHGKD